MKEFLEYILQFGNLNKQRIDLISVKQLIWSFEKTNISNVEAVQLDLNFLSQRYL